MRVRCALGGIRTARAPTITLTATAPCAQACGRKPEGCAAAFVCGRRLGGPPLPLGLLYMHVYMARWPELPFAFIATETPAPGPQANTLGRGRGPGRGRRQEGWQAGKWGASARCGVALIKRSEPSGAGVRNGRPRTGPPSPAGKLRHWHTSHWSAPRNS